MCFNGSTLTGFSSNDEFGEAVSLSGDGSIVVGADNSTRTNFLLKNVGYSRRQLADSVRSAIRRKNQCCRTIHNLVVSGMEEMVNKTGRKCSLFDVGQELRARPACLLCVISTSTSLWYWFNMIFCSHPSFF